MRCRCDSPAWFIVEYKCVLSNAKSRKKFKHSKTSLLKCRACGARWRSSGDYVDKIYIERGYL